MVSSCLLLVLKLVKDGSILKHFTFKTSAKQEDITQTVFALIHYGKLKREGRACACVCLF